MIGQQVIGLVGTSIAFVVATTSMFWTRTLSSEIVFGLFAVLGPLLFVPVSSLLIRRAHDLGWSAIPTVAAMLLPIALVVALFARFGAFGPDVAAFPWLGIATNTPLVLAVFAFAGVQSFWLMLKKGQPRTNEHGPAPS